MENAHFERLLHEIAESRRHTDVIAGTLRDEIRQNTAETVGMLRDEIRQNTAETVGMLRDEIRQNTAETVGMLRDEIRQNSAETVGMLRDEIRSTAEDTRRHFDVVAEGIRGDVRLLAESVVTLDARRGTQIEELRHDMTRESAETRAMLKLSYVELDRRLTTLEAAREQ